MLFSDVTLTWPDEMTDWLNGLTLIYIDGRKERLQESHQLQLFKANQRLLLDWTLKQTDEMVKKGLPKNKTEAESFIVEHQDWKVFTLFLWNNFSLYPIS